MSDTYNHYYARLYASEAFWREGELHNTIIDLEDAWLLENEEFQTLHTRGRSVEMGWVYALMYFLDWVKNE